MTGVVLALMAVALAVPVTVVRAHSTDHFNVSIDTTATAGVPTLTLVVDAVDAANAPDSSYDGIVTFSSDDPSAVLPADYQFTLGDGGSKTFTVIFKTAGSRTVTATDTATSTIAGTSNSSLVSAAQVATLTASGYPTPTVAGASHLLTVTAFDEFGNVATGYRGEVHFTSTDAGAVLPSDYTFKGADAGANAFTLAFRSVGTRAVTVTDVIDVSLTDTQGGIAVGPAGASTLAVTGYPSPQGLGVAGSATVTAKDAYGNTATGYAGTVHLSAGGSPSAIGDHTYTGGDAGVHVFAPISFGLPGTWNLNAADISTPSIHGAQTAITIGNDPPICTTLVVATQENGSVSDSVGTRCTDADAGPDPLSYAIDAAPTHGTVSLFDPATGAFAYNPDAHFFGSDSFLVTVTDGDLTTSETVSINVTGVNDAPTFTAGGDESRLEDTAGTITVNGWATPFSSGPGESGQTVDFVVTNDAPGLFSVQPAISPAGALTYEVAPDANGIATVTVKAHDDGGTANGGTDTSAPQTFTISVTAVNDPPTFTVGPDQLLGEQSSPALITIPAWATGISPGPVDESGQTLTFETVTNVPTPSLLFADLPNVDVAGTLTFKPAANRSGVAAVTVTLSDSGGGRVTHAFTITITGVNHDPIAVNDFPTVVAGSPATAIPVLANDEAANPDQGETLTITSATRPSHGTVRILGGGAGLTYRPAAGFIGTDRFRYTIIDPNGGSPVTATVLVKVPRDTYRPVSSAPVQSVATARALVSGTAPVRLSWSATDKGSGVSRYELWVSRNRHSYTRVLSTTSRSATLMLTIKSNYRFRVRAIDRKGNVGSFVYGPTFAVTTTQEPPTTALAYAGTWTPVTSTSYYGSHARASSVALDSVSFTFTGRNVAWLTTRAANRGAASIVVDGLPVGTVDTRSSSTRYRQVVWSRAFGASGTHTVTIVVAATPGRPRVDLDAFVVIR